MKIIQVGLENGTNLPVDEGSFKQVLVTRDYVDFHSIVRNGEIVFESIPYKEEVLYYIFNSKGEKWEIKEENVISLVFEKEEVIEI